MSYVELYSDKILDTVSVGKSTSNFDELKGDYIKVEIIKNDSTNIVKTLYSNKLLLRYSNADAYYLDDYHYHPENPAMGFCQGKIHVTNSTQNLKPIVIGDSVDEPSNIQTKYKKQIDIFRDDKSGIYIKPNEIIKLLKLGKAKYKIRIYFLRNIKSSLGLFLNKNKNNLIENGNFLAGLEATQTGDLDRSIGRNNFKMMLNPGHGKFVLEQDGLKKNKYDMRITGVEPGTEYVFSCWIAWNSEFVKDIGPGWFLESDFAKIDGNVLFRPSTGTYFPKPALTYDNGSWTDPEANGSAEQSLTRVLSSKTIGDLTWYKIFHKVFTDSQYIKDNTIRIILTSNPIHFQQVNPFGRRYYTGLRFEKVPFNTELENYLNYLKSEN